jgi:hypothetical protein
MRLALAAAALAFLAACQGPDVGQACNLRAPSALAGPGPGADWFETGNFECDNPVCIQSYLAPGPTKVKHNPYCSKACVSNRDCYSGDTGLVCRTVVLDADFLAALDPATRAKYLGETQTASYCAIPLP